MSYTIRAMFPAICLTLILPCSQMTLAADTAPASGAKPEEKAPERAVLPSRSQEDSLALERRIPQIEQQQLQAGDESFLALWKPANVDEPKGAVVIVPGAGESADWPNAVGPLRNKLPDVGWASLSLTLPDAYEDGVFARAAEAPATDDKAAADKDKAKAPDPAASAEADAAAAAAQAAAQVERDKTTAEKIFARIDSAVTFAQQNKAHSVVLLGHGTGAYWAARYMSERPAPAVQKLVMVTAVQTNQQTPTLLQLLPTLKVPTADFVNRELAVPRQQAKDRLDVSKRIKNARFTQVALNAIPGNTAGEQDQLFRRVRGWLESE
ncbi:alpha/beta hydrolase family protein [Pseudomonas putida]|uniref:alpha/beta hydrolase family protein n=1 Tax=Pseudomonas putida TaxID=303 RepID=UPI0023649500|nr:alpha/beta hydrolase family protein [Pseudomonas putida]MDD1969249.1 alpha/beta hydrolase family protein [Pseudomonas putida]